MFSFLKKLTIKSPSTNHDLQPARPAGGSTILSLKGLHCSSCAINIDLALEDLPSVTSKTSYAKSETKITFDPTKTSLKQIKKSIEDLGYQIQEQ